MSPEPPGSGDAEADRAGRRSGSDFEQAAHAAALAGLPGIGPGSLAAILRDRTPTEAWEEVRSGRIRRPPPPGGGKEKGPASDLQPGMFPPSVSGGGGAGDRPRRTWAEVARRLDPSEWWKPYEDRGVRVTWPGRPDFPGALAGDPHPPGVLFWTGAIDCLERLCVAIVGTRNATPDGRAVAFEMGRDLAAAGVCVVSGLALGIDGAAHAGALAAVDAGATGRTVGVAASGVDVPYPKRHTELWRRVAGTGAILSENLPGRPAQAWRFPTRNRIIAGLARMVVVVESHTCGGSLITAEAAIERGVDVRVVPGPVHSPASAGSNQLLYDGPGPVRHARDVLDALGVLQPDRPGRRAAPSSPAPPSLAAPSSPAASPAAPLPTPPLDRATRRVLQAMGWRPVSTGQIMVRSGLDAADVLRALDHLVAAGHATAEAGWWVRRR